MNIRQTTSTIAHWINGKTVPGASARCAPVYNPALGEVQSEVLLGTAADVDAAAGAASRAFPAWAELPPLRRAR